MENKTSGIGFLGVLVIVFIVLKLVGTITWSWWWVLAPLWGPFVLVIPILVIILILRFRHLDVKNYLDFK